MRISIINIVVLFAVAFQSCAQKKKSVPVSKQDTASSFVIPEPIGRVSDYEQIFTMSQTKYLDSVIQAHETETSNQIVIVSVYLDPGIIKTAEDYNKFSLSLFRKWGIGQEGKNNGIGILISTKLQRVRIEVGYGLEAKLRDEMAKRILDSIAIPRFKEADYFGGVSGTLMAIIDAIK